MSNDTPPVAPAAKKPLMTIGTLLTTASLVLMTIASALAITFANLDASTQETLGSLMQASVFSAAVAMGLGALGKGVYEIGKSRNTSADE